MIRLVIWAVLFAAGAWAGTEYTRMTAINACLDAGGTVDPRGFCHVGAAP
ncbi:MAG: hypothetical protein AAGH83_06595 [Pseudomonadota bacterium]